MTITKPNFTSNLDQSLYDQIVSVVGTTYSYGSRPVKDIKVIVGYPSDFKKYKDDLPLIVVQRLGKPTKTQGEIGGRRVMMTSYYIHVFAGGYNNEKHNEFMKNGITDLIDFGFDMKPFDFKNYDNSPAITEGIIHPEVVVLDTSRRDKISVFENHHSILSVQLSVWIKN